MENFKEDNMRFFLVYITNLSKNPLFFLTKSLEINIYIWFRMLKTAWKRTSRFISV